MNSKTGKEMKPFIVMDVLRRALELEEKGKHIIHMEIGEPDFDTPSAIIAAGIDSLRRGETHYTDSRGILRLRRAVAKYYNRNYGLDISETQVLITMGVSPALLAVLSSLINNNGDEIILSNPYYPCYPNFIKHLGGTPHFIHTKAEDGFHLNPAMVKEAIGPDTKAILVNSPSNPVGTVISTDALSEICGMGIPVISDEIYHGLVYGQKTHSSLEFTENTYILNGFSKIFAMTGWRLGYIIAPAEAVRKIEIILQNFFISPNSFAQRGGIAALELNHPEIEEMKKKYNSRRKFLLEELSAMGLNCAVEPKGAFYIFVDARHIEKDSYKLAFDILEKAGVALTPGIDFGDQGEGYLRLSYANSMENLAEGASRLQQYLNNNGYQG
ncbi:MAG TPA: pyridoxal phosphate-dependent aminotransferase [Candidatus Krumholzibacteriaceae bacterium]|nr:pyridoxal phosphate-dependent aminotransferase [Candidatus Krumholzibacteriaceae bacterium]